MDPQVIKELRKISEELHEIARILKKPSGKESEEMLEEEIRQEKLRQSEMERRLAAMSGINHSE